jgi:two-component system, LytTR family, sensor kinase
LQFILLFLQLVGIFFYIGWRKVSFAETLSIPMKRTFSLLLLLIIFHTSYGNFSGSNIEPLLTDQHKSIMLDGITPLRYGENILIGLKGNPSKVDSSIIRELVDTLNILMDQWDVYLVKDGLSNLTVEINNVGKGNDNNHFIEQRDNNARILKSNVILNIDHETDYAARKKIIYFYILRSLVDLRNNPIKKMIPGSVFTESSPVRVTYQPIDYEVIKFLYSEEYTRKLEKKSSTSADTSYKFRFFIDLIAMLGSMIFLILIFQKGIPKNHPYRFKNFFSQGMLVLCAALIYLIIRTLLAYSMYLNPIDLLISILWPTLVITVIGVVSIICIFIIERLILKGNENFIPGIIVPLLITMFFPFVLLLIASQIYPVKPYTTSYLIVASIIPYTFLFAIARAFYIFMNKKSESIIGEKNVALAQMGELHKQAELQSLRARINPHFLYNALNSIASLATTDPSKTEKMALALSDFFKYAINREEKQFNAISEELDATRTYLEIEKVRFGDRLNFEIECDSTLSKLLIPQLLIQPLVENAIKHGLMQITGNGLIKISITKVDHQLIIRIYDNGPAFPDGPLPGFGIRNTQERIFLLYGGKASVTLENGPDKFVGIRLPFGNKIVN